MNANQFKKQDSLNLEDYVNFHWPGRENMGAEVPVAVYRLFQYSLKDQLAREYGKEKAAELFRRAGYEAGVFYAQHQLDLSLELNPFVANLQAALEKHEIGILRIERMDPADGSIILTVAEDVDCSGLPVLGETVCNYDEGFIGGILSTYFKKQYEAVEIDCWATGDRVCRFEARVKEQV